MRFLLVALLALAFVSAPAPDVRFARVPGQGVQPEAIVDGDGRIHVVYLAGDPAAANVFYVTSGDGGRTFSSARRVNSQPGSAIALGSVRGAQIALGRDGRVHVAWNGSDRAEPRGPSNPATGRPGAPMLYARSDPERTTFEPQRNLMTTSTSLDGGGSIAADPRGGIFVAWHAGPPTGEPGEEARQVWVARSIDDGATFSREAAVSDPATGACGCCALRLYAEPGGYVRLLYRSARETVHRDIHALLSRDRGRTFAGERLHPWSVPACPMSSMSFASGPPAVQAWETEGQVYFNPVGKLDGIVAPPARGGRPNRKHPRVAVGRDGTILLAWADGVSANRGGAIGWQAFAANRQPLAVHGRQAGLSPRSFPAVVARADGGFTVIY